MTATLVSLTQAIGKDRSARGRPARRKRPAPRVRLSPDTAPAGPEDYAELLEAAACHGEALLLADLADDPYWPDHTRG